MFFDILTLFPGMFSGPFEHSIMGRARERDLLEINLVDIRDYTKDKHSVTDDYPYGGGAGMVMKVEPIFRAVEDVKKDRPSEVPTVLLSPQGRTLNQDLVKEYSTCKGLILICGHYEGVDERVRENIITDEISIGDYVLTGGELPAMVLVNAVARMLPSVLGDEDSIKEDSFFKGLLGYPQYTRPREYRGLKVPEILLSGDHARIKRWRSKQALKRTLLRRPDLITKKKLSGRQEKLLAEIREELGDDK